MPNLQVCPPRIFDINESDFLIYFHKSNLNRISIKAFNSINLNVPAFSHLANLAQLCQDHKLVECQSIGVIL